MFGVAVLSTEGCLGVCILTEAVVEYLVGHAVSADEKDGEGGEGYAKFFFVSCDG